MRQAAQLSDLASVQSHVRHRSLSGRGGCVLARTTLPHAGRRAGLARTGGQKECAVGVIQWSHLTTPACRRANRGGRGRHGRSTARRVSAGSLGRARRSRRTEGIGAPRPSSRRRMTPPSSSRTWMHPAPPRRRLRRGRACPGRRGTCSLSRRPAVGQEAFAAPVAPVPAGAPTGQSAPRGAALLRRRASGGWARRRRMRPSRRIPWRLRIGAGLPSRTLRSAFRGMGAAHAGGLLSRGGYAAHAGAAPPQGSRSRTGASPVPAQPPYGGARGSAYTRRSPVTRPRPPGPAAAAVGRAALCGRLPRADAAAQEAHGLYVGIGVTVVVLIALVAAVGAFVLPELLASDDVPASERIEGRTVTTRLRTSRGRGRR